MRELARIAFVNAADLIDPETAQVLPDASPDDLKVISGVKVKYVPHKELNDDGEIMIVDAIEREVKMCDKVRALDMLCKHLGLRRRGWDRHCGAARGYAHTSAARGRRGR